MFDAAYFLLGLILGAFAMYRLCVRNFEKLERELKRAKQFHSRANSDE